MERNWGARSAEKQWKGIKKNQGKRTGGKRGEGITNAGPPQRKKHKRRKAAKGNVLVWRNYMIHTLQHLTVL